MVYRPVREKDVERLKELAYKMLKSTGHEEISLSSLSSSDYSQLEELVNFLIDEFRGKGVNISLPSLRIDAFSLDVMSKVQDIKKSSLTFAPEAGSQRLRDVINKGLTEEVILNGSRLAFEGFMSVYKPDDEKAENNVLARKINNDSQLSFKDFDAKQHFTQPPAHYTEASLVKTLEELGIGRPSTYAPTITTIIARRYVAKENKNLYVTELGEVVNRMMVQSFPSIVDVNFTANLEYLLDKVGEGVVNYKTVIRNFYPDLDEAVQKAEKELEEVKIEDEVSDVQCDQCGRMMVIKYGPHGKFLACPGFPECRNTKTYFEKIGVSCPKCGKDIVIKKTKKGRRYYGCMGNPECDFMTWQRPSDKKCPECGSVLLHKGNKLVCMNETCGFVMANPKEDE